MGLMLSILISCVGVVELLTFYSNVRRNVVHSHTTSLELRSVTQNYLKELERERNRILDEIAKLEGENQTRDIKTLESGSITLPSYTDEIKITQTPRNATDITNFETAILNPVKEKHTSQIFPSYTNGDIKTPKHLQTSHEEQHIVITDSNQESSVYNSDLHDSIYGNRESSPFPTYEILAPRNSICELAGDDSIRVSEADEENYRSRSPSCGRKADVILKSTFDDPAFKSLAIQKKSTSKSRSRTPDILKQNQLDFEEKVRSRSPSPNIQRLSKSETDLFQTPGIKRNTSEEFLEKHQSFEVLSVRNEENERNLPSEIVDHGYWKRSPSPFQKVLDTYASSTSLDKIEEASTSGSSQVTIVDLDEELEIDREILNSVDGIKNKQTNEDNKRQFKKNKKRKGSERRGKNLEVKPDVYEQSDNIGSVVTVDENALSNKSVSLEEVSDSPGGSNKKKGEPFWVMK